MRKAAMMAGMFASMALASGAATASVVDRGAGVDHQQPTRLLLASASTSNFDTDLPRHEAYPAEWFEPAPELVETPALRTSVVWHATPRQAEGGPPKTALVSLLFISALAFSVFVALGRAPARNR